MSRVADPRPPRQARPPAEPVTVSLRPSPTGGVLEAVVDGQVICRDVRPILGAARALEARGYHPHTELVYQDERGRKERVRLDLAVRSKW